MTQAEIDEAARPGTTICRVLTEAGAQIAPSSWEAPVDQRTCSSDREDSACAPTPVE